ncbi:hypothetical protein [Mucilaginibacter sp. 44-25]|nr:hypothetical protein [Mucilaginibacter sp. 44-25]
MEWILESYQISSELYTGIQPGHKLVQAKFGNCALSGTDFLM